METLRAQFQLVNHFPTPVAFTDVLKGCSCAQVTISPERLEPGNSATLTVEWHTGGRRGKATEVVTVYALKDGLEPAVVQVRLSALIEPDVRCEPPEVRFACDEAGTATLRFTPGRMPDVRICSAHPTIQALQTTIDPEAGTVAIRYDPSKSLGGDSAVVIVQTTSTKEPWVRVPVVFSGSQ
jgi:hypothetical protein